MTETQNIISMINNGTARILETYHNNFSWITTKLELISRTITSLQSEIINDILLSKAWIEEGRINKVRHHHPPSHHLLLSHLQTPQVKKFIKCITKINLLIRKLFILGSDQNQFSDITLTIWTCFKEVSDRIMHERNLTLDEMCYNAVMCIRKPRGGY